MKPRVALARDPDAGYPEVAPFHPSEPYPELVSPADRATLARAPNAVYPLLRECFLHYGLDRERFGTPDWNPLEAWVPRGGTVVVKPNFVLHERESTRGTSCLITHAAVLRAIIDYVLLAGGPGARVIIADAPLQMADFGRIASESGLDAVVRHFRDTRGAAVELQDLRRVRAVMRADGVIERRESLPGDPLGYTAVKLGRSSYLMPISGDEVHFAVSDYDRREMSKHHAGDHHEYLLSTTALACDTFINVPKLKTHQKVGVTLSLKNLVGINGSKDWLPHYRPGAPNRRGDEFETDAWISRAHSWSRVVLQGRSPRIMRAVQELWRRSRRFEAPEGSGKRIVDGAWHGNDTAWRMVLDLNQAIFHASATGELLADPARRYLAIVDGIVGGEGDGPLSPRPRPVGLLAMSDDAVALDRTCAHVMGFDPERIPMLREALSGDWPITRLRRGEDPEVIATPELGDWRTWNLAFRASPGWTGWIEREAGAVEPLTV